MYEQMPNPMVRKLLGGNPQSTFAFIRVIGAVETNLSFNDARQLEVHIKSMIEVATIWEKRWQIISGNGNVMPPDWNAEEDLKKVQNHRDDSKFSHLGRALATLLTDLLQVIDLDMSDLQKIAVCLGGTVAAKHMEKL